MRGVRERFPFSVEKNRKQTKKTKENMMQIVGFCIIIGLLALALGLMASIGSHMQSPPRKRALPTVLGGAPWSPKPLSYRNKLTRKLQAQQKRTRQRP